MPQTRQYTARSSFGSYLAGTDRNTNTSTYRYGYNGMEKDSELKNGENSYTTEFRFLDPRLGRWFSCDPKFGVRPFISPYNSMSNCPIVRKDPKGDDDYYDETGRFLYHSETVTTDIRVMKNSDFTALRDAAYNDYKKTQKTPVAKPIWENLNYEPNLEKLNAKSVIVKVQSQEDQEKVFTTMETKTTGDGKETSGNVILEVNTDPNTKKIVSAKLYVEVDNDATRTTHHIDRPNYRYHLDDPDIHYVNNGKMNKIILAGIHTHPDSESEYHGPSTEQNAYDPNYVDTKISKDNKTDEYVLDNKELYRATPNGGTEQMNRKTTSVAKEALKTHSENHY